MASTAQGYMDTSNLKKEKVLIQWIVNNINLPCIGAGDNNADISLGYIYLPRADISYLIKKKKNTNIGNSKKKEKGKEEEDVALSTDEANKKIVEVLREKQKKEQLRKAFERIHAN